MFQRRFWVILFAVLLPIAVSCSGSPEAKKAKHLERGDSYFAEQKFKEAIIEYKNVIQLDGSNAHAFERAGLAYLELGEAANAFAFLSKARDLNPENLEVRLKLGNLYLLGRKPAESREEANAILERDPKHLEALVLLCEAAMSPEELDEALQRVKEVEADHRNQPRYHMALGTLYFKKKDLLKAESAFMDALAGKSDVLEAHMALGDIHLIKKDFVQAEQEYKAAADLAPGGTQAQLKLADFYLRTGKPDQAKQVLEGVTAKAPDFIPALYRLATLALDQNKTEDALKYLDPVFAKNPSDLEGLKLRGRANLMQRKTTEGLQDLEAVLKVRPEDAQAQYLMGLAAIQAGDIARAKVHLKEAGRLDPFGINALLRLAELNIITGALRPAAEDLFAILDKAPRHPEAQLLLADAVSTPQEVTDALRRLEANQLEFKNNARFRLALGTLYLKQGKLAEAEAAFKEALSLEPTLSDGHLAMGRLFETRKDPVRAEQEFRTAAELAPDNAQAKVNLADFYLRQNKIDAARQVLDEVAAKSPDYLPALYRQANLICRENQDERCLGALEPIFKKNPTDSEGLLMRGRLHLAKGQNSEAIQDFQEILKQQPKASQVLYLLSLAYLQAGDIAQAKTNLQAVLNAEPNFTEAGLRLAEIQLREGNYQPVIELVGRLFEKQPKTARVYYLLAAAYTGNKEWPKAVEASRKLMEMDSADARGPFMLAFALREQGKKEEARKYFEEASRLSPDRSEPVAELVALDLAEKRPEVALERVTKQLARFPEDAGLHFLLGRVHLARKDSSLAEAEFLKSAELDPKMISAYVALTELYAASQNFEQASAKLEAALKANPDNVPLLMLAGMISQQRGDHQRAQQAYEKILAINPGFAPAANNLAWIYSEIQGDQDKAFRLAQKAREGGPDDPQIADTLGWILYKKGNYEWALSYLKESAAKLSSNAEVQFHLGMTQFKLGDAPAARQALERALKLNPSFPGAEEARKALQEL